MHKVYQTALATGIGMATMLMTATPAFADGVNPTATMTPTGTPKPETRVECTTGAYGQQTCKTVVVTREASAPAEHKVVNSGVAENIVFAMLALFVISSAGYAYSKVNA
jgi:hypothetical protein